MSTGRTLVEVFSRERPRLVGLAYRMTGSRLDAEDIVQEAWFRAERTDWSALDRPEAWLTTVVSRLALDSLKSTQRRRETYVGPWLPEPVVTRDAPDASAGGRGRDPADVTELAETLTLGFMRLLESLSPVERVVFILADVFDTPFREISATVGRPQSTCRQIASRARRRIRADQGRQGGHDSPDDAAKVAYALAEATASARIEQVVALLAEDAVLVSDGGPEHRAARRPVLGADRIARLLTNLAARQGEAGFHTELTVVNNEPGAVVEIDGQPFLAVAVRVNEGLVREVHIVRNPSKLVALDVDTRIV